jgi:hypothetical protein
VLVPAVIVTFFVEAVSTVVTKVVVALAKNGTLVAAAGANKLVISTVIGVPAV